MLRLTIDNGLNGFLDGAPLKSAQVTNLAVEGNGYLIHRRIFRGKSGWAWIESCGNCAITSCGGVEFHVWRLV